MMRGQEATRITQSPAPSPSLRLSPERAVSRLLVPDLGISPEIWLVLTLLVCVTLFFKFSRIWSVRNLDLLLLFAPAPGIMALVGGGASQPWVAFLWLFFSAALWLSRCLIDVGLVRRPLLEPNLNAAGLACLASGMLGLLVAETVSLPMKEGAARNPANPETRVDRLEEDASGAIAQAKTPPGALLTTPRPGVVRWQSTQIIVARILAGLSHFVLVAVLIVIGWRHFERPIAGLAVATCYLLCPYTRIAVVDSGQLVPAALIVTALAVYRRPGTAGAFIGLASGWMPACLGLIPLWAGFYRGRGAWRFTAMSLAVVMACVLIAGSFPVLAAWARALGVRTLAEAGLLPHLDDPPAGSFWLGIDSSYRLPVLIAFLALVLATAFWPAEKDLGGLIALSAALLVASQFWYLDRGGTLILIYLPLLLLMMFRPNLASKRPTARVPRADLAQKSLFPVR